MSNIPNFLNMIQVYDTEHTKVRIGNAKDGGYVALREILDKTNTAYCFGIGNDIGFEEDLVSRYPKIQVEAFDPFIPALPKEHKRFTFHKYGIGLKYRPITGVIKNSLLKMDTEWDEWGAFQLLSEEELKKFNQILVEFHLVHMEPRGGLSPYFHQLYNEVCYRVNEDLFAQYCEILKRLLNWFIIFHIHANNSLPLTDVDGWWLPPLLEVSMVRKDFVKRAAPTKASFPTPGLDFPNKTDRPDIIDYYPLGNWSRDAQRKVQTA